MIAALVAQGPDATLRHARLYETRYVCVMRRDHPLARKKLTLDTFCAAQHLGVSFSGRAQGPIDRALADIGRQRRLVLTVNQFFTAGRVVTQSDLLDRAAVVVSRGHRHDQGKLVTRELPFDPGAVHVEMVWHLRRDADARAPLAARCADERGEGACLSRPRAETSAGQHGGERLRRAFDVAAVQARPRTCDPSGSGRPRGPRAGGRPAPQSSPV